MHMIFDTIYDESFTIWFIDQITDDSQKFWSPSFIENSIPVFYREHSLEVDLVVSVGHAVYFFIYIEPAALLYFCCLIAMDQSPWLQDPTEATPLESL